MWTKMFGVCAAMIIDAEAALEALSLLSEL